MLLALRSILFAALLPGSITVIFPYLILGKVNALEPAHWAAYNYLGLAPILFGGAILFRCIWDFAVAGRGTLAPVDPPKNLVVRGLYRYVRNPMYVGVLSILLGESLLFGSLWLLGYTVVFFGFINLFVMIYEERVLRRQFGESYVEYCRRVNRWLPSW